MKTIIFTILSTLLLTHVIAQEQYPIEDFMWTCMSDQYKAEKPEGIGFEQVMDSAHAVLLAYEALPEISGESFMNTFSHINATKSLPFRSPPKLASTLEKTIQLPPLVDCRDSAFAIFDEGIFTHLIFV